jgi:hypothetical protein
MKKKKMVCLFVAGSEVKKTFPMIFLLSRSMSNKHGLDRFQRSKEHFLLGSKVKKTFSSFGLSTEKTPSVLVPRSWVGSQKRCV